MKRNHWIIFLLFAGSNVLCLLPCRAQDVVTYRSVVRDSVTRKGLSGVHIFSGVDSTGVKSNADGTFRLKVKKGETVRFRKVGYRWLNVKVSDDNVKQPLEMAPSNSNKPNDLFQFDAVEVNGKLLPKEEYHDVNYITDLSVSEMENKKYKVIIKTN